MFLDSCVQKLSKKNVDIKFDVFYTMTTKKCDVTTVT